MRAKNYGPPTTPPPGPRPCRATDCNCTGAETVQVFCEAAQRALEELARCGMTVTIGVGLRQGKIDSLWAEHVPLVVNGEQKVHLVPSQSWEER